MMRTLPIAALLMLGACANGVGLGQGDTPPGTAAVSAMRNGAPQVAVQIDNAVLARDPRNVAALLNRGDAQTALQQPDAAAQSYIDALQADPHSALARIGLGRLRLAADPAAAEALFLEASQVDPSNAAAWNDLGIARDMLGRHRDAQAAYRQAIGLDPSMRGAEVNLALSVARDGRTDGPVPARAETPTVPTTASFVPPPSAVAEPAPIATTSLPATLAPPSNAAPTANHMPDVTVPVGSAAAASPSQATSSLPTQNTALPPVVLTATADAWMQVHDRSGQVLLSRTLHRGESWPVPARPNLLLTTGNAGGTDILLGGAAIPSLGASGVVRRDIPLDAGLLEAANHSSMPSPMAIASARPPTAPSVALSPRSPSTTPRSADAAPAPASAARPAMSSAAAPDAAPAPVHTPGSAASLVRQPSVQPTPPAISAPPVTQPQTASSAATDATSSGNHGPLAASVSPGMRALTVAVDGVTGTTGLIWPGDRVDLILTRGTPDDATPLAARIATAMVLSKVRVIGIDQPLAQEAAPGNTRKAARTVTFEVDRDQAERVAVATRFGRLWLAARSADTADEASDPAPASPTRWASEALAVPPPTAASIANHIVRVFPGAATSKEFHF